MDMPDFKLEKTTVNAVSRQIKPGFVWKTVPNTDETYYDVDGNWVGYRGNTQVFFRETDYDGTEDDFYMTNTDDGYDCV